MRAIGLTIYLFCLISCTVFSKGSVADENMTTLYFFEYTTHGQYDISRILGYDIKTAKLSVVWQGTDGYSMFYDNAAGKSVLHKKKKYYYFEIDEHKKTYSITGEVPHYLAYSKEKDGREYLALKKRNSNGTMIASLFENTYGPNKLKIVSIDGTIHKIKEFGEWFKDFYWLDDDTLVIVFQEPYTIFLNARTDEQIKINMGLGINNVINYGEYFVTALWRPVNSLLKHTDLITELKNRESKTLFQTKLYGKTYKVNDYFIVIGNGEYFFPRYDVAVYNIKTGKKKAFSKKGRQINFIGYK